MLRRKVREENRAFPSLEPWALALEEAGKKDLEVLLLFQTFKGPVSLWQSILVNWATFECIVVIWRYISCLPFFLAHRISPFQSFESL